MALYGGGGGTLSAIAHVPSVLIIKLDNHSRKCF